jgi:heme-degrading monooxygenase HmoA
MKRSHVLLAVLALGAASVAIALPGCRIATPFDGPGWDDDFGLRLPDAPRTVVVTVTQGTVAAGQRARVDDLTRRVVASLPEQEGLVGWSVRREILGSRVWTMTVWRDGEAADDFLVSSEHRAAMRESSTVFSATAFARVEWPAAALPPTWDQAESLLASAAVGRR